LLRQARPRELEEYERRETGVVEARGGPEALGDQQPRGTALEDVEERQTGTKVKRHNVKNHRVQNTRPKVGR
jgi:hypothetical protein